MKAALEKEKAQFEEMLAAQKAEGEQQAEAIKLEKKRLAKAEEERAAKAESDKSRIQYDLMDAIPAAR